MKKLVFTFLILLFLLNISCKSQEPQPDQIAWDTWGVPHISAKNTDDLFYAQGWAQMHNHTNTILELYGNSRGKAAEYWGKDNVPNDMLINALGFDELAEVWSKTQDQEQKDIFKSFVDGLNAYATAHPEAIEDKNKVVLPITSKDMIMHSMYVIFTRFIAGGDLGRVQQWPDLGSNAYAIGPKKSASGNAMLVQNPHLPWWKEFLFFESQLNLGDKHMYGATLVGLPGISIGFNDNLGWSHTNNTIDNADIYELELKDGGYLLDGERKDFETSSKTIKIKVNDSTWADQEITLLKTVHGPVVKKTEDKVLALRMVGLDKPNVFLQWWYMIQSNNFEEFEEALKMAQIPYFNVMYADKKGNIFYLFNGLVPKRSSGDWNYWDRIIPGGKSADVWTDVHPYSDLPKIKNPELGWLQNANDPPWTSTIPITLHPEDYPAYMSPIRMSFRPQRSTRMLLEDDSITYDELVQYKLSTHLEFADRILDDLFKAIDASSSEKAKAAKVVLENWDRKADADSKGMLLFYNWSKKFNVWDKTNYSEPWSIDKPNTTPDGLANPEKAVQLLEAAVTKLETKYGKLDVPWGDYYRINYNGKNLPANGIDGSLGIFRVAWAGDADKDHMYVGGGDSWVGVIEFGDKVHAKVLLSYGNSTQKDSPHNGDQLELFSKKELRDAWFTQEEIEANTAKIEKLSDIKQ
ncbi:MAG: acylase [Bacteroidetes bacterium]|nr:MAG: acylase [Bacteroidota bacterium]